MGLSFHKILEFWLEYPKIAGVLVKINLIHLHYMYFKFHDWELLFWRLAGLLSFQAKNLSVLVSKSSSLSVLADYQKKPCHSDSGF